jgi:hypothetical protein
MPTIAPISRKDLNLGSRNLDEMSDFISKSLEISYIECQ